MNQSYTIEHKGRLYNLRIDGKIVFKAHELSCVTAKLEDLEKENHPAIETHSFNLEIKSALGHLELQELTKGFAETIEESLLEQVGWEFDVPTDYVLVTIS